MSKIIAATLFSGIGAPECAAPDWDWIWHAEIEPFPSAVMKVRHPQSVNLGDVSAEDFVERASRIGRPDVLVFGSPCQDFSVAGLRLGLDGARGNMALLGLRVAQQLRIRWLVFENVPGLFSSYSGSAETESELLARGERERDRWSVDGCMPVADCDEDSDFAAFLAAVRECGYLGCWRVFDAQHSGVPQRRRRIFFVGHLGDWRPAAAVLLEPESLRGDRPPSREAREGVAGTITRGLERCSADEAERGTIVSGTLDTRSSRGTEEPALLLAPPLNAGMGKRRGSGAHGDPLVSGAVSAKWSKGSGGPAGDECYNLVAADLRNGTVGDVTQTLQAAGLGAERGGNPHAMPHVIAFDCKAGGNTGFAIGENAGALRGDGHGGGHAAVLAFEMRDRGDDGRGYGRGPNLIEEASPSLNTVKTPAVFAFVAPTLPSGGNATGGTRPPGTQVDTADSLIAMFKPSHFTRGKDGAPSDLAPGLSADADKGDQDAVLLQIGRIDNADAEEADTVEALRALLDEVGEEAFSEWALGVLAAFWPQEVLRSEVHGRLFRCPTEPERGLVNYALSCEKTLSAGTMPPLWHAGCDGRAPPRFRPQEQLSRKLGAYLSQLPYSPSPAQRLMRALWATAERHGLLREALSAVQEARRSVVDEGEPAHGTAAVRRLTAEECEALQAYPRGYTLITYRGKPAADGPRYRALGNSMCVRDVGAILRRIALFEKVRGA